MITKLNKGLCGEYAVCSELLKRGYIARITEGNAKGVDIVLYDTKSREYYRVEVKTTTENKVITGFFQKYYDITEDAPDYWIFVYIDKDLNNYYYIMTHDEVCQLQMQRNNMTYYHKVKGCDNLLLKDLESFKDNWNIFDFLL